MMSPKSLRRLLTGLHALMIIAILSGSLPSLAAVAAPSTNQLARPVSQGETSADNPETPSTTTPTPEFNIEQDSIVPLIDDFYKGMPPYVPAKETPVPQDPSYKPLPAPVIEIPAGDNSGNEDDLFDVASLEGILDEAIPPNIGETPKPSNSTTPSLVPIALKVEMDRYVLAQGEQSILQVKIGLGDKSFNDEVEVTLTLPPQLQIVGDAETTKVWTYDGASLATPVQHTFNVEINPSIADTLPTVTEILLEVAAEGYETRHNKWVVGITNTTLRAVDGAQPQAIQTTGGAILAAPDVTLLVPASAVPADVQIQYTPIYTGTVSESDGITSTGLLTAAARLDAQKLRLPLVFQGQESVAEGGVNTASAEGEQIGITIPSIPSIEDNGLTVYRQWHLSANGVFGESEAPLTEEDAQHPRFATPVLMVVNAADLVGYGINMGLVGLWTRPDASQPWTLVQGAKYDAERRVWFAWLNHFSDFAEGIVPSASNERLPSVDGFSSDRHTGAATINYPILTPAGLGGLSPNLSLDYSSVAVDDVFFEKGHSEENRHIQANMAGYGWNLGGVNYIAKYRDSDHNVYYTLILNGASYDIRENPYSPGTYDTNPLSFAAITNTLNTSTSIWRIKTPDGAYYEFGGDVPDLNWPAGEATRPLYVEMRTNLVNTQRELEVVAWYLRKVKDTAGNTLEYHYDVERGAIITEDTGEGGCIPDVYAGEDIENSEYAGNWYNPVTRIASITWGSNEEADLDPTLRVLFSYDERNDYDHTNDPEDDEDNFVIIDGCQPRKTKQRLEEIQIQAREYDSDTNWNLLHRYNLDSDYAPVDAHTDLGEDEYLRHLRLRKIHEYGANGGLFNTQTFTYTKEFDEDGDTENSIWLTVADNGFGGKTTYTYKPKSIVCVSEHGQEVCGPDYTRHLVAKTQVEDGQGIYYVTGYGYSAPHILLYNGRQYNFGVNHSTTTVYTTTSDFALTVNYTATLAQKRFEEQFFYQFTNDDLDTPDPKHGRLKQIAVYDNSNEAGLYSLTSYQWTSSVRNSATDFITSTNLMTASHWVHLDRQDEWVSGTYTTTISVGSGLEKRFYYEKTAQDGNQFGNLTRVDEYSHPETALYYGTWQSRVDNNQLGLQRRTKTKYYPNAGWPANANAPYIVNRPANVIVEDSSGNCAAENRTIYADFGDSIQNRTGAYNEGPATAYVIKSEQVLSGCPYSPTTDRETSSLLVTTYALDEYGNEIDRTSHNGGGANNITLHTEYDTFYHLFPVERWNTVDNNLKARSSYYGVGATPLDVDPGYWGATSETCEINDVCTRFTYDQYGRKVRQWDRQPRASSWPADSAANVLWGYRKPGELDPSQKTYIVTEWRAPRCDGNWIRRQYDGLGQLVIEQKSYQDYQFEIDGCGNTPDPNKATGHEIVKYFEYDALGNLWLETIPQLVVITDTYHYYAPVKDWSVKKNYYSDALGRVGIEAFGGSRSGNSTIYMGRETLTSLYRFGIGHALTQAHEVNALGYTKILRLYWWNWSLHRNVADGELDFTTNAVGKVTKIDHKAVNPANPLNGPPVLLGTSVYTYDQAGRLTSMDDVDLGQWSYSYNRHSQPVQQKHAVNIYTCFYYDGYARLIGEKYFRSISCPTTSLYNDVYWGYGASGSEAGKLVSTSRYLATGNQTLGVKVYTTTLDYNPSGQVISETVHHSNFYPITSTYGYDSYGRINDITYPGGEQVSYGYNGMGLQSAVTSSIYSTIVDGVGYDVFGRIGGAHLPAGSGDDLYLKQSYYPWNNDSVSIDDSVGRLKEIRLGTQADDDNKLLLGYRYDYFGNIKQMDERYAGGSQVTNTFLYDLQNRLTTSNYYSPTTTTQTYSYYSPRPYEYAGKRYSYTSDPIHGVSQATRLSDNQQLAFTYDTNGNMLQRQYFDASGVKRTQGFVWAPENLVRYIITNTSPIYGSYFLYDADKNLTTKYKLTNGGISVATLYPFPFYELVSRASDGSHTPTRYYLLNGQAIALRIGGQPVTYLHRDQVGSVVMTSQNGVITDTRQYFAYGAKRGGDEYPFDQNYTGQRLDDTGLIYMNARFYDPELGMFISPDSIIPDPNDFLSYNRYLYGRGNPISNNDPTGHTSVDSCNGCGYNTKPVTALPVLQACGYDVQCTFQATSKFLDYFPNYSPFEDPHYNDEGTRGFYKTLLRELSARVSQMGDSDLAAMYYAESLTGPGSTDLALMALFDTANAVERAVKILPEVKSLLTGQPCSFSAETLVMTDNGLKPIAQIKVGDQVLAYNEELGTTDYYTVTATMAHEDPILIKLVINGEIIETTPEHPFYTDDKEWIIAEQLQIGDYVYEYGMDEAKGLVLENRIWLHPEVMYNLTVDQAHTYFVGEGMWLVHNNCGSFDLHGIPTKVHFWDELGDAGIEEADALRVYLNGKLYTSVDGNLITYDKGSQIAVVIDRDSGAAITTYYSEQASSRWGKGWAGPDPRIR